MRRAAWGALAAIVPALIIFVWMGGVVWSLPIAALAAIGAASLPVRGADRWARQWIAAQRGLGYETSLEADGRDDPYGFWRRSREATLMNLRDAPRPAPTRWWLPPAIATLLVIVAVPFLPDSGLSGGFRDVVSRDASSGGRAERESTVHPDGPNAGPSGSDEVAATVPESRDAVDQPNTTPAPQERDEASDEADDRPSEGDGGRSSAEGAGGSPVDQFLRDLDTADEDGTNPFEPVQGSTPRGAEGASEGDEADLGAMEPSSAEASDSAEEADGSDRFSEGSDASSGRADEANDPGDDDAEAADDGVADGSEQADGDAESAASLGSGSEGEGEDAESGRAESGQAGGDAESDDAADAARRGDGASPDDAGLVEGDEADGGGAGEGGGSDEPAGGDDGSSGASAAGGNASPVEAMPGAPDGPARRLPGEREDGQVPTVGSVRGAGAPPDAVPEGRGVTAAEARSAERTSEEQGLPGAYREIIRRYFR